MKEGDGITMRSRSHKGIWRNW